MLGPDEPAPVGDLRHLVIWIGPPAGSRRLHGSRRVPFKQELEHTMMRPIVAVLSVFAVGACAHEKVLEPAAGAALAPGRQNIAEAATAGVTIRVTGDAWKGESQDLRGLFTPVRVAIRNESGKTLRVRYSDFQLSGASGSRYAAISPGKAQDSLSVRDAPSQPSPRPAGWAPPHSSYLYPDAWAGPFGYEAPYYDQSYVNAPQGRPAPDLRSDALSEAVVQDGGRAAGFVYFQNATEHESAVEFEMTLADAKDDQAFGRVAIPLQTVQR
jgi:hypothetical protein